MFLYLNLSKLALKREKKWPFGLYLLCYYNLASLVMLTWNNYSGIEVYNCSLGLIDAYLAQPTGENGLCSQFANVHIMICMLTCKLSSEITGYCIDTFGATNDFLKGKWCFFSRQDLFFLLISNSNSRSSMHKAWNMHCSALVARYVTGQLFLCTRAAWELYPPCPAEPS